MLNTIISTQKRFIKLTKFICIFLNTKEKKILLNLSKISFMSESDKVKHEKMQKLSNAVSQYRSPDWVTVKVTDQCL